MEYYHFFVDAWRFFKRYKDIATNTPGILRFSVGVSWKDRKAIWRAISTMNIMIAFVDELEAIAKGR